MKTLLIHSSSFNPYHNLALEQILSEQIQEDIVLYLWQNQNTIVIGKNQNVWKECSMEAIKRDNISIARRNTGGGAVFHDTGNLNFTFIMPKHIFDIRRQLHVIQNALSPFGIDLVFSGRNDLIFPDGKKVSGNAYHYGTHTCIHHGTLLIHSNIEKMADYLTPSKLKLKSKSISSVHSHVSNLIDHNPDLTCDLVKRAITRSFVNEYGDASTIPESVFKTEEFFRLEALFSSWNWIFGESFPADVTLTNHFDWGDIELQLVIKKGVVHNVQIYSDSIDTLLPQSLSRHLMGCKFSSDALSDALRKESSPEFTDFALWLKNLNF